jgi:hypothetical protein
MRDCGPTAVSTLNSSEVMYLKSVVSNFMIDANISWQKLRQSDQLEREVCHDKQLQLCESWHQDEFNKPERSTNHIDKQLIQSSIFANICRRLQPSWLPLRSQVMMSMVFCKSSMIFHETWKTICVPLPDITFLSPQHWPCQMRIVHTSGAYSRITCMTCTCTHPVIVLVLCIRSVM